MFPVCTIDPIDPIDSIDSKTETGPIRRAEQSGFRPRLDTALYAIPTSATKSENVEFVTKNTNGNKT